MRAYRPRSARRLAVEDSGDTPARSPEEGNDGPGNVVQASAEDFAETSHAQAGLADEDQPISGAASYSAMFLKRSAGLCHFVKMLWVLSFIESSTISVSALSNKHGKAKCPNVWIPPGKQARSVSGFNVYSGPNFEKVYADPAAYWDQRYERGDHALGLQADSGSGSRGLNAKFKAKSFERICKA